MNSTIAVIEDDPDLAQIVRYNLTQEGYTVEVFARGDTGLEFLRTHRADLAIVDVMLPGITGWDVCSRLRASEETSRLPLIFLTARSGESDKLHGFSKGADDYLTKPFSVAELIARVKALLRRVEGPAVYVDRGLTVDWDGHTATVDGATVAFTAKEFDLLRTLVLAKGKLLSRQHLLDRVWGFDFYGDPRTLDVHVRRVRAKLGAYASRLQTVKSGGYRWSHEAQA